MSPLLTRGEAALAEALDSGRYGQGAGKLRLWHDGARAFYYCCLGVACEVSGLGRWVREDAYAAVVDRGTYQCGAVERDDGTCFSDASETSLPRAVRRWLGWKSEDGELTIVDRAGGSVFLSVLNDGGMPFRHIADLIRAGLVLKGEIGANEGGSQ
jgi:hypothetical protein